jgi:hypothetical protein
MTACAISPESVLVHLKPGGARFVSLELCESESRGG